MPSRSRAASAELGLISSPREVPADVNSLPADLLCHVLDCLDDDLLGLMSAKSVSHAWCKAGRRVLPQRWPGLRPGAEFAFDALPSDATDGGDGPRVGCHGGRLRLHADGTATGVYACVPKAAAGGRHVPSSKCRGRWNCSGHIHLELLGYCSDLAGACCAEYNLFVDHSELTVLGQSLRFGGDWKLHDVAGEEGEHRSEGEFLAPLTFYYSPASRRPPHARGGRTRRERAAAAHNFDEVNDESEPVRGDFEDAPSRPPPRPPRRG